MGHWPSASMYINNNFVWRVYDMIRKILGPPGTGKTTKLIGNKELKVPGYVSTFLKLGTPLNRIGYFAFSRKAANEAKERMLKLYPQYGYRELKKF